MLTRKTRALLLSYNPAALVPQNLVLLLYLLDLVEQGVSFWVKLREDQSSVFAVQNVGWQVENPLSAEIPSQDRIGAAPVEFASNLTVGCVVAAKNLR